jgi:transposase
MQAIGSTAPDLPPKPGVHAAFARDHEYKRHGTVSLLAGIDLVTGKVHALVKDRHRSCEFIEFLHLLDSAYPASNAIKIILDNHSAHTSKETKAWLAAQPEGRFEFTFTPKHGSWLTLAEGFLLQAGALRAPTHPSHFQTRACGARLGRHRGRQPTARRAPFAPPSPVDETILADDDHRALVGDAEPFEDTAPRRTKGNVEPRHTFGSEATAFFTI